MSILYFRFRLFQDAVKVLFLWCYHHIGKTGAESENIKTARSSFWAVDQVARKSIAARMSVRMSARVSVVGPNDIPTIVSEVQKTNFKSDPM